MNTVTANKTQQPREVDQKNIFQRVIQHQQQRQEQVTDISTHNKTLTTTTVPTTTTTAAASSVIATTSNATSVSTANFTNVDSTLTAYFDEMNDSFTPKPFHGLTAEDVRSFVKDFEAWAKFRKLHNEERSGAIRCLLRDEAREFYDSLDTREIADYDRVRAKLLDRYSQTAIRWKYNAECWQYTQAAGIPFERFFAEFHKRANKADLSEEQFRNALLTNMRPNLRLAVISAGKADLTAQEIAAFCVETDQAEQQSGTELTTIMAAIKALEQKFENNAVNAVDGEVQGNRNITQQQRYQQNRGDQFRGRGRGQPRGSGSYNNRGGGYGRGGYTPYAPQQAYYAQPMQQQAYNTQQNWNQSPAETCNGCGRHREHLNTAGVCPAFGSTCNHCNRPNHFARMCRARLRGEPRATPMGMQQYGTAAPPEMSQ